MRIDTVRVIRVPLRRTDPGWKTSLYADTGMAGFVLEVRAEGASGRGATSGMPLQLADDALEAQLRDVVAPALQGRDPRRRTAIMARLQADGVHRRALIAADLALHDLLGHLMGQPCHVLWGGAMRAGTDGVAGVAGIEIVRMIGLKTPQALAEEAASLVSQGIRHLKVKLSGQPKADADRLAALWDRVGSRRDGGPTLAVDANGAYDLDGAQAMIPALRAYDVAIFEQPLPPRDLDGLRAFTRLSPVPVMADQGVTDVATALAVCRHEAARMVAVKLTKMGTVDECRRVAELCAAFGVEAHLGGSAAPAAVDVAGAHLVLASGAFNPIAEVGEFEAVEGDPLRGARIEAGCLRVTDEPGFGLTLAEA